MALTKTDKKLLAPYAALYMEIYHLAAAASDVELIALGRAANAVDQTNCGWDTYGAAKIVGRAVLEEQYHRKAKASPALTSPAA